MLKIGVTGGIGSGKSVVCNIFKLLGIPVFDADKIGKYILDNDSKVKSKLAELIGPRIFSQDGSVNRERLAEIIFNDDNILKEVNGIIHPAVKKKFSVWCEKQDSPYIIHEAAILFESGFYKLMDYNILISAPKELRIKRVFERDHLPVGLIEQRMNKQWADSKKEELADVVIYNDKDLLIPKVLQIDKQIKENGKIW